MPPNPVLPPESPADKFDVGGFVAGLHAGYNHQIGQFVIGAEGDIDYNNIKGSHPYAYNSGIEYWFFNGQYTGTLKLKSDWQASARLRAGYAFGDALLYGTGGIAVANGELTTTSFVAVQSDTNTHVGWTAGIGSEFALHSGLSLKGEWLFYDLGTSSHPVDNGLTVLTNATGSLLRVGLNKRF